MSQKKSGSNTNEAFAFLSGDSELARLIKDRDWSTSLGPIPSWPQSLRTIVGLLVKSPVPIVLLWGEDGVMIYNDAYSQFAGGRHPNLLGSKVREGWPEVAAFNDNVMKVGLAGGVLAYKDQELTLHRSGAPEQVWMNLDYSPVIDESGKPAGVIAIVVETTERVLAERRVVMERDRLAQMFAQAPSFMALLSGPEHRFELANPGYLQLIGHRAVLGRTVAEALPEIVEQGFVELLDHVIKTGETYRAVGAKAALQQDGGIAERYLDFVYQPITDSTGAVSGVFVQGVDVTERVLAERRRAALVQLSDALSVAEAAADAEFEAAKILASVLNVARVGYGAIDANTDTLTVHRDWTGPGVSSLVGSLLLRNYGSFVDDLKLGQTVVIPDIDTDPRTAATAQAIRKRGVQAFVNVPIIERGELVAMLIVNGAEKRLWSKEDVDFIREVAARTHMASERIRARNALAESEERYRTLFNAIDEGFCVIEFFDGPHGPLSDYLHIEANPAYAIHTGIPDVVGKTLRGMVGAEADDWVALYAGVLKSGKAIRFERELEETGRWLELAAFRVEPPSRKQVAVIFRDLTAKKHAEIALRVSEDRFRTLARAMPNHAWTADATGALDWFNEQVYAYSGSADGALDGAGWARMVHPDDLPASSQHWAKALSSGEEYQTEFRLRRADGVWRWHLARAVAIREGGEIVRWIGTNTDIQDQKDIEEALSGLNAKLEQRVAAEMAERAKAEDALRQAQKMEAIGQLTGGIAHDFNNLLGAIGGSLSLIERRLADGKPGAERFIGAGQDAVRRAAALTQRLLAFSRQQTLDPKSIDVNKLIAGMEELIRRAVGPDVEVEVVGAGGLWLTKVDVSQLESSLLNLCINGRDAMAPKGGRLTIETANKWLDERAATERDLPPGQYISLCVTDTGSGMTQDVINRAFEPFFTTKPIGQGTGLGLSMVYGFVRQSGGQVRIYSEIGMGTTLCLYLPRYMGAIEDVQDKGGEAAYAKGEGETVLVIDDEPILRMLIANELIENGYSVLTANDGPSGLKILRSDTRIDLLITDVGLPAGMNGRQIADIARTSRPGLKVLFVTGYAENAAIGNGHLEPGMEVLAKPFEISELARKVRTIIDQ